MATGLTIGPRAKRPLKLRIPLFVSDMSFGALSEEAKIALAQGAERAGTGICSGEGGSLVEERRANSRYLYELASAKFGWSWDLLADVQAFHFKGGQGAKTGTGGHLPAAKVTERIAEIRGLEPGQDAVSPPTFDSPRTVTDFRRFADEVRERSGGIPVGFKLSANHIEADIDFALEAGADYIILDGRGGGTGAAPLLFRDHISVPTIPALGPRAGTSRSEGRPRRHAAHHRRPSDAAGLRQGARARGRWGGPCQFGDPGHRVRRGSHLQLEQLPFRHRDPEAGVAAAGGRPNGGEATGDVSGGVDRADARHGQSLRPPSAVGPEAVGPDDLEARAGRSERGRVRRTRENEW